ncbi:hypothetical protein [Sinorhizobium meliloti]|nr:hypothetical protein [Sinorhizobium meliloti]
MIPDLTNASDATREYYALPEDIRSTVSAIVGNPRQPCAELPGDDEE